MRPVLFTIFGIPFPAYWVFFAVGFAASFVWGYFEAKRLGIDPERALDLGMIILLGAVVGSRILYVIIEWDIFRGNLWEIFRVWNGGMVLFGGVFGVIIFSGAAVLLMKLPVAKSADLITISANFGLIFGQMGCIFNGCCYGRPTSLPWGICYTDPRAIASRFLRFHLHPAPVYAVTLFAAVFIVLYVMSRRKKFDGQLFWTFYILYPLGRFIVEFFRGDPRGWVREPFLSRIFSPLLGRQTFSDVVKGVFFHEPYLSTSQFIAVFVMVAATAGYIYSMRRAKRKKTAENG